MSKNIVEAALTASAEELKNEKSAKAKRILMGVDVHLRGYQSARKVDNGVIGAVETCRSEVELLLHIQKQRQRAEEVVVVYEAGPLGYTLYRKLTAGGVLCYVCAPDNSQQRRKRVKNNKIDARSLTSRLFNYLNGDQNALQLARVPSEAQEQQRLASRQHDQLVEERKRLGAKGNAMLLSQGLGSWSNWWRPKAWSQLSTVASQWLLDRLQIWLDVLKILDEKICQAKAALARGCRPAAQRGWRPESGATSKRGTGLVAVSKPSQDRVSGRDGTERVEYRRQRIARLDHQSGSAGASADHYRDGLADDLVSAPI
jgi:hypothetical protein